jgi:hypothetical protein
MCGTSKRKEKPGIETSLGHLLLEPLGNNSPMLEKVTSVEPGFLFSLSSAACEGRSRSREAVRTSGAQVCAERVSEKRDLGSKRR